MTHLIQTNKHEPSLSHLISSLSILFSFQLFFKGTQVVKLIVILIPCHTSLLLDINLSGPLLSTLASHRNTVAAQGHLQHISMINHHLSLRTDLPCVHSVCSGVWVHLHMERKTERAKDRRKENQRRTGKLLCIGAVMKMSC